MSDQASILDASKIIETAHRLRLRIEERFPDANLSRVAAELEAVAERSKALATSIARPIYAVRIFVGLLLLALPLFLIWGLLELGLRGHRFEDMADFLEVFHTAIETLVFVGAGVAFLVTIEFRLKRSRVNSAIHELRALAHLVDSHQLSKDPIVLLQDVPQTSSSPERGFDALLLGRYLGYCSEMLSVIGKIAALYGQNVQDSTSLDAIDRVETLTTGLSHKVWQKLSLLRTG